MKPLIEVLTFTGCPHAEATHELVVRVVAALEAEADVVLIDVPDQEAAAAHRFLGSPTVRVDGRDVEPGAERRDEVVLGCRIYHTDAGLSGRPDERWIRDAVSRASCSS
ncbi:MAG: DF family (seleno)protein [Gaiellaceae bacterium]